jgi:hypothetical protein
MNRDLRYDFFRGLALLAITVNHAQPAPNVFFRVGHFWFFDWADLFVFISGSVCGLAYYRRVQSQGLIPSYRRALGRSFALYLSNLLALTICLALACIYYAQFNNVPRVFALDQYFAQPLASIRHSLLMWSPPDFLTVLNIYILFLLLMPAAIWLYLRNRPAAITLSLLLYLYAQAQPRFHLPDLTLGFASFGNPLAWQLTFNLGLWLGIERKRDHLHLPRSRTLLTLAVAALALGFAARYAHLLDPARWYAKHNAKPLRLIELLLVAYVITTLLPAHLSLWKNSLLRPIIHCGKRALPLFCASLVASYAVTLTSFALHVTWREYAPLLTLALISLCLFARFLNRQPKLAQLITHEAPTPADVTLPR